MSELILGILSYRREGSPPAPTREPTPQEWASWSGRIYGQIVRLRATPPVPDSRVVLRAWERLISFHRKETALHLFQLALERTGAPGGEAWEAQAERWQEVYLGLPGGHPPESERMLARMAELRAREKILKIKLAS